MSETKENQYYQGGEEGEADQQSASLRSGRHQASQGSQSLYGRDPGAYGESESAYGNGSYNRGGFGGSEAMGESCAQDRESCANYGGRRRRVLEEVYVAPSFTEEEADPSRAVYRAGSAQSNQYAPNSTSRSGSGRAGGHADWCQVFDLETTSTSSSRPPSTLICHVLGDRLVLQIMHWTDEPLRQYCASQSNSQLGTRSFPQAERSLRESVARKFAQHQTALLIFEGQIVPSLQLSINTLANPSARWTSEDLGRSSRRIQPFTLTVATSANLCYLVDFAPYFFSQAETISVRAPQAIQISPNSGLQLSSCVLRHFEIAQDPDTNQDIHIYGMGVSLVDSGVASDIGQTLQIHYLSQDRSIDFSRAGRGLVSGGLGFVGKLTRGIAHGLNTQAITQKLGATLQTRIFAQEANGEHDNYETPDDIAKIKAEHYQLQNNHGLEHEPRDKREEQGVVAIRVMGSMVCVVFSDGTMQVRSLSLQDSQAVDVNLLDQLPLPECLGRIEDRRAHDVRITDAKISFVESDQRMVVGIAYEISEFQHLRRVWKFDKVQLNLQTTDDGCKMRKWLSQVNAFQQISSQELVQTRDSHCSVSHLALEGQLSDASNGIESNYDTLISLWNDFTFESCFVDLSSDTIVLDRQMQEELHRTNDSLSPAELQFLQDSQSAGNQRESNLDEEASGMEEQIRAHLCRRLTAAYRYTPAAINAALGQAIPAWKDKFKKESTQKTASTQLEEVLQRLSIQDIRLLQEAIVAVEKKNSKVLCFAKSSCHNTYADSPGPDQPLDRCSLRLLVRPLGISMLRVVDADQGASGMSEAREFESFSFNSSLACQIDAGMVEHCRRIQDFESQTFKQTEFFNLQRALIQGSGSASETQLLVHILSALKLSVADQYYHLRQSIAADPSRFDEFVAEAFSQQFQFEDNISLLQVQQGLQQVITEHYHDVSSTIEAVVEGLVDQMNNWLPARARILFGQGERKMQQEYEERSRQISPNGVAGSQPQRYQMTQELQDAIEKAILNDLEHLDSLITDLRMLQEFMTLYSLAPLEELNSENGMVVDGVGLEQPDRLEQHARRSSLNQRLAIRHQQLLAAKSVLQTKVTSRQHGSHIDQLQAQGGQPRDGTILSELIQSSSSFFLSISSQMWQNATEWALSKYVCMHPDVYHPDNISLPLLSFLDRGDQARPGVYVRAMAEYLKLLPDSTDFGNEMEGEHEWVPGKTYRVRTEEEKAAQRRCRHEAMMLLEYYRAYVMARLDPTSKVGRRRGSTANTFNDADNRSGDLFAQYRYHINNCLNDLFSPDFSSGCFNMAAKTFSLRAQDRGLDTRQPSELEDAVKHRKIYECVLVMSEQFSGFDRDMYQLIILQRAVDALDKDQLLDSRRKVELRDLLYERIFNACKPDSEGGIQRMYEACGEMSQGADARGPGLKAKCIKVFMEKVIGTQNIEPLKNLIFDNKNDIPHVLASTRARIESLFQQRQKNENLVKAVSQAAPGAAAAAVELNNRVREQSLQQGVQQELYLQLNLLNVLADLYNWNDEVASFLWVFHKQVKKLIISNVDVILSDFETKVEAGQLDSAGPSNAHLTHSLEQLEEAVYALRTSYLEIHHVVLTCLSKNMHNLSSSYSLVDDSEVVPQEDHGCQGTSRRGESSLRRPSQDSQTRAYQHQNERMDLDLIREADGQALSQDSAGQAQFVIKAGALSQISFEDVRAALLLCRGELLLSKEALKADSPDQVVQMLTELGLFDEAIELALSSKLASSAYCLASMIEAFSGGNRGFENSGSSLFWSQKQMASDDLDHLIIPHLKRMSLQHILDLCKLLIGQGIDLPKSVASALAPGPLVAEVISAFWSFSCNSGAENASVNPQYRFNGLHSFMTQDLEQCVKSCAETDVQSLMGLVASIRGYKATLQQSAEELHVRLEDLEQVQKRRHDADVGANQYLPGQGQQNTIYPPGLADSFTAFQAALCASIGSDPASGVIQKAIPVIDVVHELEAEQDGHFDVGEVPVVKAERAQYRRARDLADKFAHFDDEILKILRNTNLLNANLKPSNQIPQEKPLFSFSNRV